MSFGRYHGWVRATALGCALALAPGDISLLAQEQAPAAPAPAPAARRSADQLDSLVAPIALYPDPLLAQVLAASTYPLEIVQAARWLKENAKLKGEELTKAAAKQPWDASVSAMVAFPDALNLLDKNLQWTQDLGNAFLDQQSEVMDAVQRMRKKAKDAGKLETTKEQKVEVKTVETKTVVVIQPADPQVIYVPTYSPTVVYGPPVYAYPPVVYPSTGAIVASAAVSFGVGVMMGAMWSGCCYGGWGWNTGWGGNNVVINNNFNNRYGYSNNNINNINGGNRNQINGGNRNNIGSGNSNWQHNPQHRGAVPYQNKETAQRFKGTARDSAGQTQRFDGRGGQTDRAAQNRGAASNRQADRGGSNRDAFSNRGQTSARPASNERVGSREIGAGNRSNSAFGGGQSRSSAQAASDRGFSSSRQSGGGSMGGARSSGGMSRGGGGRRR